MGKVSITVLLNAIVKHYCIESHIPCLKDKSEYQEDYKSIVSRIDPVFLQKISLYVSIFVFRTTEKID